MSHIPVFCLDVFLIISLKINSQITNLLLLDWVEGRLEIWGDFLLFSMGNICFFAFLFFYYGCLKLVFSDVTLSYLSHSY